MAHSTGVISLVLSNLFVFCTFEMDMLIPNPATCEVWSVIGFLNAKGDTSAEIYRQIVGVYGDVMNKRNVAKWCHEFTTRRTDIHDKQRTGKPSLITDDLVQKVEDEICADRHVTIKELQVIPEVSKSLVHETVKERLDHKLCAQQVPKMLTEKPKKIKWCYCFSSISQKEVMSS